MESSIIGKVKIDYLNGMVQHCDVISQSDYDNIIKPSRIALHQYKSMKPTKQNEIDALKIHIDAVNNVLKPFGDNFVTTESPIYLAIETGMLVLPDAQGGLRPCKVELL